MDDLDRAVDDTDVEGHRLAANDNEIVVQQAGDDVEARRRASDDGETDMSDAGSMDDRRQG
ncbi:MAG TPA: hypothetical protein VGK16_02230 [Candidatus Limnocylindrales bacterium]|jgi:hypothetical protein